MAGKKAAQKPAKKKVTSQPKPTRKLTVKQEAFTEHYLANGFNGTKAAKDAGYQGDDNTLRGVAHENLTKPNIQARVRARIEGLAATADEVLALLGDHCAASHGKFIQCWKENGDFDLAKAEEIGVAHLIKKIKRRRKPVLSNGEPTGEYEFEVELELHDSQAAAGKMISVLGLKQKPGENEKEIERKRQAVESTIRRLIADGWTAKEAKEIVLEAESSLALYVN